MSNLVNRAFGRYQILEQLGHGGMATVYKAYDTHLERDVAIKVIRKGAFPPEQLERILKRFEREAKALARLTHPNIVPVIDYGEHDGAPYLVMPYLPGGTLKQQLGKPMPWAVALRLLLPVARALDYAHQHNILHRDVKPSNILLTEQGEPMLTDFGIAKILDLEDGQTLTATGVGIGTPEYMSPEQGLGKPVDARSDVYSLGVVLYELVTGCKPFQADTPMAVVVKHLNDQPPRPTQFTPGLPDAVEKILLKALAKQPQNRYQSMAEMANALERTLLVLGRRSQAAGRLSSAVLPSTSSHIRRLLSAVAPFPSSALRLMSKIWPSFIVLAFLITALVLGNRRNGGIAPIALSTPGNSPVTLTVRTAMPSVSGTITPSIISASPTQALTLTNTGIPTGTSMPVIPITASPPVTPTRTSIPVIPTRTNTLVIPTNTNAPVVPVSTDTPIPTATRTLIVPTSTSIPAPPSPTSVPTPAYSEARVRYIMADIQLSGLYGYYASFPDDPDAVEAVRRWDLGIRVANIGSFERKIVEPAGWQIVYAGTNITINGMDVQLTGP